MKLYYCDVLAPRKVCAALKMVLKLPVDYVYVDLGKGENRKPPYKAINPNGKVPTLVDGERVITEADTILCYLSDKAGADLWPSDKQRQFDVMSWFSWNAQHFLRATGSLYFEYVIKDRYKLGAADPAEVEQALAEFRRCGKLLNAHLKDRKWLVGDRLSAADISVAVTLPYAAKAHMPIDEFPEMRRWHDQLCAMDGWLDPFPQR
ncbi:MAG: glutathione S-transferase family protein [Proteobacteria bacterium]|nr:glutathione S-transferase family protein [Pseudomonadota bacterium]